MFRENHGRFPVDQTFRFETSKISSGKGNSKSGHSVPGRNFLKFMARRQNFFQIFFLLAPFEKVWKEKSGLLTLLFLQTATEQ